MGCGRRAWGAATMWVLLGVACVLLSRVVDARPATPPDLDVCEMVEPRPNLWMDCCLPTKDIKVKEFQFPDKSEPVRIRKNMATLDEESIEKLNQAYLKMRALPSTDPRSWHVQSNIHCGYCEGVYKYQNSSTGAVLEIHGNWMLFPFHRWYVYFQERILGSLIGDPTLAIPYFNWDNSSATHYPPPNAIPEWMYTKPGLLDENRDPLHAFPNIIDLHFTRKLAGGLTPEGHDINVTRAYNDAYMYQAVVSGSSLPNLFMSGPYRLDEELPIIKSLFESGPHFAVHMWVGSSQTQYGEDMGPAFSAARDPIFYTHHCNVDRIYKDWHGLGGRRSYPSDPDFLDASFLFYDELGELVRVTAAQSLELEKLRYDFEPTENAWTVDKSVPHSTPDSSTPSKRYMAAKFLGSFSSWLGFPSNPLADWIVDIPDVESLKGVTLTAETMHLRVARSHAELRASGKLDHLEEVLVVDDIYIPSKEPIWFDIFINLPGADVNTPPTATEWCGRYTNEPQRDRAGRVDGRRLVYATSIGEKVKKLGIVHQPSLVVSLVPKGEFRHQREVHVRTIRVELQ